MAVIRECGCRKCIAVIDFMGEGLHASCRSVDSGSDFAGRFSCAVVGFGGFRFLVGVGTHQVWSEINCGLREMGGQDLGLKLLEGEKVDLF